MTPQEYRDALNLAHKNMNYLEHHGIKGQRWGIRRFQNEDGTYTDLGAERRREDSGGRSGGLSDRAKKAIKIGAIAAGSALAVYGGYKIHQKLKDKKLGTDSLPFDVRKDILPFAKGGKFKEGLKSFGEGTKKVISDGAKEAGKASVAAAIAAIGTIAIRKLSNRFADNEEDSQRDRDLNYIAREASVAAVKSGTNASANGVKNFGNNSNNNNIVSSSGHSNGGGFTRDKLDAIISRVGKPHQTHSWSETETDKRWQNIMKQYNGNNDAKEKIRGMKKTGFDIDQIEQEFGKK